LSEELQLVVRTKPRLRVYLRKAPATIKRPTPAQAETRLLFARAVEEAKNLTIEQVAELVGGVVVEVNGKKAVMTPDGRVLMKHMAYVAHALRGYKSPRARVKIPAWLELLSRTFYTPLPAPARVKAVAPPK
jgi:hypothetical protein